MSSSELSACPNQCSTNSSPPGSAMRRPVLDGSQAGAGVPKSQSRFRSTRSPSRRPMRTSWASWDAIIDSWTSWVPSKMLVMAISLAIFWKMPSPTPSRK